MIRAALISLAAWALPAGALTLPEAARLSAEVDEPGTSVDIPRGAFTAGTVPSLRIEGDVRRQAWHVTGTGATTLQVYGPMREELESDGYQILFECDARACGGFDFRFAIDVLPSPDMYVDLRDYQFLSAVKGAPDNPSDAVTLLVSRSLDTAYVQIVNVQKGGGFVPIRAAEPSGPTPPQPQATLPLAPVPGIASRGFVVLDGLEFETGETSLGPGPFDSLEDLATYLTDNPRARVVLVGHTDTTGPLDSNIAISKARAASVRQRLIDAHAIAPDRLEAEGMGYLAPRATNRTPEGREANRRVEAVLLP